MNTPKFVPEEFLQFIWENKLFDTENLTTEEGSRLVVLNPGKRNTNSGPDFFNTRLLIDDTEWAGNVEVHKKASDWLQHNHHQNRAYDNVVLHVVEDADKVITRNTGESISTLVIKYPERFKNNYQKLLDAKSWISCENDFYKIDPVVLRLGFNRLMIERLEDKTAFIEKNLTQNESDWAETFYRILARTFGFKVNSLPFELLAKAVPLKLLAKHKNNRFQLEALLFGTSGMLNDELIGDDYYLQLREEYSFLYKKYKLNPIESHLWKFMRLRPVNFPTIRISQLAALINKSRNLFSRIIETEELDDLKKLFRVKASEYWDNHYRFNKKSKSNRPRELGGNSINILLLNAVIPFLFVYGENQNQNGLKNRALEFLEKLPPESNSIINNWKRLGIEVRSAFESQALLQLKNIYCDHKKCLNCQIGNKLVKNIPE